MIRAGDSWLGSLTPWDLRAIARGAALTLATLVLALLVTATTDEGGLAWSERVARVIPVVPVCAALATVLALGGRDRGEGRALEALGRSPVATGAGAAAGAAGVGLLVALLVLVDGRVSVSTFFPTVHAAGPYLFETGVFSNLRAGWRVMADGSIMVPDALASPFHAPDALGLPDHARLSAAFITAIGSAGFALTLALAPRVRRGRAALLLLATAAASTFCLQAAAAGRMPVILVPVPSTLLLLGASWAIFRHAWPATTRSSTSTGTEPSTRTDT